MPMTARLGSIGVLERDGAYLLIERAVGLTHAGAWCFPGGHVEPGETSRNAVIREIEEELGLLVEPLALLGTVHVESTGYVLDTWRVVHVAGEIRAHAAEIAAFAYLTPDEIRAVSLAMPSNAQVLRLLGI